MITKQYVQEVHDLVVVKIPGINMVGACELSAFPIAEIKAVLAAYASPRDKTSAYSSFKRKLYAYYTNKGFKPAWKEAYDFMRSLGYEDNAPREDPKKGMDKSSGPSSDTLFNRKYRKPDYIALFDEFETRRRYKLEPKDMLNPFTARRAGMLKAQAAGLDYHEEQEKERAEILRRRMQPDEEVVPAEVQTTTQPTPPDAQEINKLVSNLKETMVANTNTLSQEKIPVWSKLDDKTKSAYFKALVKSQGPLESVEEIVVDDQSVWEEVDDVPNW